MCWPSRAWGSLDLSLLYPVVCWSSSPSWAEQNKSKFEHHHPQPAPLPDSFPGGDCQHQVRKLGAPTQDLSFLQVPFSHQALTPLQPP